MTGINGGYFSSPMSTTPEINFSLVSKTPAVNQLFIAGVLCVQPLLLAVKSLLLEFKPLLLAVKPLLLTFKPLLLSVKPLL
jgi:hypothetical protein